LKAITKCLPKKEQEMASRGITEETFMDHFRTSLHFYFLITRWTTEWPYVDKIYHKEVDKQTDEHIKRRRRIKTNKQTGILKNEEGLRQTNRQTYQKMQMLSKK
jgi:hypothetical protein